MSKHLTEEFILKSYNTHGHKYDYSKVNYINSKTKVEIICSVHGSFFQTPNNHLRRRGCFMCSKIKKLTQEQFINRSSIVHNKFYDYSKVNYFNAKTKVEIVCPEHGSFLQNPNHHLRGFGCDKCSSFVSKPEIEFLDYLKIPNTIENRQIYLQRKKVDGYDKDTKTIYEFLGDYYHGNPLKYTFDKYNPTCNKTFGELYENTKKRFSKLKNLGYKIKYIWESDWKRFKSGIDIIPKILEFQNDEKI